MRPGTLLVPQSLVLILFLQLWSTPVRADGDIGVFTPTGDTLRRYEVIAIGELFSDALAKLTPHQVVPPEQLESFFAKTGDKSRTAQVLSLFQFVELTGKRSEEGIEVRAQLFSAKGHLQSDASVHVPSIEAFEGEALRLAQNLMNAPREPPPPHRHSPSAEARASREHDSGLNGPPEEAAPDVHDHGAAPPVPPDPPGWRDLEPPGHPRAPARAPRSAELYQTYDDDDDDFALQGRESPLFEEVLLGFKAEILGLMVLGMAFDPMVSVAFSARMDAGRYFLEFAVGIVVPTTLWQDPRLNIRRVGGVTSELGASIYFNDGTVAWYGGGGILPRILGGDGLDAGIRLAGYAQVGVDFFRDRGTRVFAQARAAQNMIPYQVYSRRLGVLRDFYPTEASLQIGVGW